MVLVLHEYLGGLLVRPERRLALPEILQQVPAAGVELLHAQQYLTNLPFVLAQQLPEVLVVLFLPANQLLKNPAPGPVLLQRHMELPLQVDHTTHHLKLLDPLHPLLVILLRLHQCHPQAIPVDHHLLHLPTLILQPLIIHRLILLLLLS